MLAAFSPGSDFKRYYRGRMPRLALIVIILMPLMYGALYLWAFWNPFNAVDKIPVALVNADVGTTVQGNKLDAGAQVAQGLIDSKQLDLHEVSEKEAAEGVRDGKYYFSITLPKDFSESVASPTGDNPHSARLIFTYNDANNYLSTVMGQDAAQQVVNKVSAQVGAQTFDIVLSDVSKLIPKLKEAQAGVNQLNAGMKTANSGAHELSTNLVTAKNGAGNSPADSISSTPRSPARPIPFSRRSTTPVVPVSRRQSWPRPRIASAPTRRPCRPNWSTLRRHSLRRAEPSTALLPNCR
ncbi:hypothetical protein GOOTI_038_00050 [Gordonia otitidis NBRC 100426]|uniref:ABC-2 type transporter transmembrane domain-containing protein n=1 Tax=Gordonia otitidis (strain DSM 44809 / CCUG 52243 / JCM 12355 / NBRC 100426 / IFM 10032) TaxID=1108044 RepID=H5THW5_GORO1|nr:hypothetical protein GOOTI_038_00050 [Gordonia otitidis NBRC 100426]